MDEPEHPTTDYQRSINLLDTYNEDSRKWNEWNNLPSSIKVKIPEPLKPNKNEQ